MIRNILKIWLRKNQLTPDPNDYSAVVSSMGSVGKKELIDDVIAEGTEYKRETVEDIVNRYNRCSANRVLNGWNVDTGLVYMRPVVTGVFYDRKYNPAKNSVYVSVTQGPDLRKQAGETEVQTLGEMPDVMYISRIINMQSKAADNTLSRGRNAQVEGAYLKVTGNVPEVGVYLVNVGTGIEIKLDEEYMVVNDPSKLILLIPAEIEEGIYQLKIVSQFTGANKLLNAPRTVISQEELTVI